MEPQSTAFFLLLIVIFGGLMWWLAVAKHSAISDLTNANPATGAPAGAGGAGVRLSTFHGASIDRPLAAQEGYTLHLAVRGRLSHIKHSVYVYLPPQYFQPEYRNYRFPAIELLHGFPGQPQDWITVVGVTTTLQQLIAANLAPPVPQFWLGVGSGDRSDLRNAAVFEQLLQVRQPGVTLKVVQGGGHTMYTWRGLMYTWRGLMYTWRGLMPSLLEWMTPRLAEEAALQQARRAREARADHRAAGAQRTKVAARHRRPAIAVRSPDAGS